MSNQHQTVKNILGLRKITIFLAKNVALDVFLMLSLVVIGFLMTILSLTLYTRVTPSSSFGASIEGVVPPWYWLGIALMIVAISFMLARLEVKRLRLPFLISCILLIFSMRSALAILSPFPYVQDTWGEIYITLSWRKYGLFSPEGLRFFNSGTVRGWPASFVLAYFFTNVGIPVYSFYKWAPTVITILDLIAIYLLFKELANEKVGMVSAFLFTLLNTAGFFPLHYCPQTLGALLYLVAMYAIVRAYKTRKIKNLVPAILSIFGLVLVHHMSTFFLGISLAGVYLSRYFLTLQRKVREKSRWFPFTVNPDTFIKFSLPISVFTFAVWYFYGFIVYQLDAITMLTKIMRLLITGQPEHVAGYFGRYLQLSPLLQLSILIFPAFIFGIAAIFLLGRMWKKEPLEGYLWLTLGWAGALTFAFIIGNLLYGNYIEPLRAQEILLVALFPASTLFLLRIFESHSLGQKVLITIILITVAFFSVLSVYRGAQSIIYFEPPWWIKLFNPP